MSNEQRAPGWLGYIGDDKLPSHIGIFYEAIIRIPISQPVQPKLYSKVFFRGLKCSCFVSLIMFDEHK